MCNKCDELDEKIARVRRLSQSILDEPTIERLTALLSEYEKRKKDLHPEE